MKRGKKWGFHAEGWLDTGDCVPVQMQLSLTTRMHAYQGRDENKRQCTSYIRAPQIHDRGDTGKDPRHPR